MGTKNEPGKFDCYSNAEPDEPMFVLLGRDPVASLTVLMWCTFRQAIFRDESPESEKIAEAKRCAEQMWDYAAAHGKSKLLLVLSHALQTIPRARDVFDDFVSKGRRGK